MRNPDQDHDKFEVKVQREKDLIESNSHNPQPYVEPSKEGHERTLLEQREQDAASELRARAERIAQIENDRAAASRLQREGSMRHYALSPVGMPLSGSYMPIYGGPINLVSLMQAAGVEVDVVRLPSLPPYAQRYLRSRGGV